MPDPKVEARHRYHPMAPDLSAVAREIDVPQARRNSQPRVAFFSGSPDVFGVIAYQNYDDLKRFNGSELPKEAEIPHIDQSTSTTTEQTAPETSIVKSTQEESLIAKTRAALRNLTGR